MSTEQNTQQRAFFHLQERFDALMEQTAEQQNAELLELASIDPTASAQLRALIDAHVGSVGRIAPDIAHAAHQMTEVGLAYAELGHFRLTRELGRGGMGRVYLGERTDGRAVQKVAIKLLDRQRFDTAGIAQFALERQILARLNHANIARFLDAGETDAGAPYVTMEFVDGPPLNVWALQQPVLVQLAAFGDLLGALGAAHAAQVLHRDIKPSNVLVENGAVKLIDFGIASANKSFLLSHAPKGYDNANATNEGATENRALSIPYAAPEQFAGAPALVATDVYALGCVLYELMFGHTPIRYAGLTFAQAREKNSTAPILFPGDVITHDQRAKGVGASERAPIFLPAWQQLATSQRRDLCFVVATALAKAPENRYADVSAFAKDIHAVIQHGPVSVRWHQFHYRVQHFFRRFRWPLALAALASSALLIVLLAQARNVVRLETERNSARRAQVQAESMQDILLGTFSAADPETSGGKVISVSELLAAGGQEALARAKNDPELHVLLSAELAKIWLSLGENMRAQALLAGAENDLVRASPRTQSRQKLAKFLLEYRLNPRALVPKISAALAHDWPPLDRLTLLQLRFNSETRIGTASENDAKKYVADIESLPMVNKRERQVAVLHAAQFFVAAKNIPETKMLLDTNLSSVAEDDLALRIRIENLRGTIAREQGDAEGLITHTLTARVLARSVYGAEHPKTLAAEIRVANAYRYAGKSEQAAAAFQAAGVIAQKLEPADPLRVNLSMNYLSFLADEGRSEAALREIALMDAMPDQIFSDPSISRAFLALSRMQAFEKLNKRNASLALARTLGKTLNDDPTLLRQEIWLSSARLLLESSALAPDHALGVQLLARLGQTNTQGLSEPLKQQLARLNRAATSQSGAGLEQ
jgi:eukaryotic-like serine/threonine-protein kinase